MSRRVPPWRRGQLTRRTPSRPEPSEPSGGDPGWERREVGSEADAIDLQVAADDPELLEFMEADVLGAEADPVFKQALREKLWRIVRMRYSGSDDEA